MSPGRSREPWWSSGWGWRLPWGNMPEMGSIDMGRNDMPKRIFERSIGLKDIDRAVWERMLGDAEERLRPVLADVPMQLKRFPGECFRRAIYIVRENPKLPTAEYILGDALSGGFGQHGWVEYEDLVFDPVLQEWYRKEGYYASEIANPWYRFSRPATMYLARKMDKLAESTFRWDLWLQLPFGKNTPISLEQAKAYFAEVNRKQRAG